jgi:hypothetical protein
MNNTNTIKNSRLSARSTFQMQVSGVAAVQIHSAVLIFWEKLTVSV